MADQKTMVLHIGKETFLLSTPQLTRTQLLNIESLADAAFDDFSEELLDTDAYGLCEWFLNKVRELYHIELINAAIDYEIIIRGIGQ